jgi:hypothetical protein
MSGEVKDVIDGGGFGTAIMSIYLFIADKLSIVDVNQYLISITSICGIVWVVSKIRGQRIDNKLKQRELDNYKEDSNGK